MKKLKLQLTKKGVRLSCGRKSLKIRGITALEAVAHQCWDQAVVLRDRKEVIEIFGKSALGSES